MVPRKPLVSRSTVPRVSVVVPVFNAGDLLRRALDSVAAQTYPDHELVVVDDGSTDERTVDILRDAARRPGVTLHRTPNRGPACARNLAVSQARGDYVVALDADDSLAPAFLERTVPLLEAEPDLGVAHTWVRLVGRHHGVWKTGPFALPQLLASCTLHVSSLYRRVIWEQVGGYDPQFVESCEDWDFWVSAAARGWTGRAVEEPLAFYRRTAQSRETTARLPVTSASLMRKLVAKHRDLYAAHLEEVCASMYERAALTSTLLERVYHHPVARLAVAVRGVQRRLAGRGG